MCVCVCILVGIGSYRLTRIAAYLLYMQLLRKNRPHTVWHKPGDASPLHSPTGANPVDKDDADGAEVDEDEDATPEPEDNDIIEEDIPEDIASNKKASGWVSDSNPKGGVRKGII